MNKKQLVQEVARKTETSAVMANRLVSATIDAIQSALVRGERVTLVGFGAFEVRKRATRAGRNPQNGQSINIPSANVPKFKAGKPLKEVLSALR